MVKRSPFRYFKTSPEVIRPTVVLYDRSPLSLRNVEDLLHERGIDVSHETVRFWRRRFGPLFAAEMRRRRVERMRPGRQWRWHLDEILVRINGETHYLWRAIDHEGDVLESFVTKARDRRAALKFLRKSLRRHGRPDVRVTDRLRSYGAALRDLGRGDDREMGRWANNRAENSLRGPSVHICRSDDANARCCGFGGCERCRNLPLFMPRPTTISIRNARSTADRISS